MSSLKTFKRKTKPSSSNKPTPQDKAADAGNQDIMATMAALQGGPESDTATLDAAATSSLLERFARRVGWPANRGSGAGGRSASEASGSGDDVSRGDRSSSGSKDTTSRKSMEDHSSSGLEASAVSMEDPSSSGLEASAVSVEDSGSEQDLTGFEAVDSEGAARQLVATWPTAPAGEVRGLRPEEGDTAAEGTDSSEGDDALLSALRGFEGMDERGKRGALAAVAPASRKVWHERMRNHPVLPTTPLLEHYLGEEMNLQNEDHLPNTFDGGLKATGTHYADSAAEFGTDILDGKLQKGGQNVHSIDNKKMWDKDKDERLNFAMDAAGSLYTADPKAAFQNSIDAQAGTVARNNHSSLLGGAAAAAAGTAKVREGKVEEIADNSGHYQPAIAQTHGAVARLVQAGAMNEELSSVRLNGRNPQQKDLLMSTTELMAYGPEMEKAKQAYVKSGQKSDLDAPERTIRARHDKKSKVLEAIRTPGQRERLKPITEKRAPSPPSSEAGAEEAGDVSGELGEISGEVGAVSEDAAIIPGPKKTYPPSSEAGAEEAGEDSSEDGELSELSAEEAGEDSSEDGELSELTAEEA